MRSLLISILSLSVLIGGWTVFYFYSEETLEQIIDRCETSIMPAVEEEQWDLAYSEFKEEYEKWHEYRKKALFSGHGRDQRYRRSLCKDADVYQSRRRFQWKRRTSRS